MSEFSEMTVIEKYNYFIERDWRYIPDPDTWSGGVWIHDELGFVNNGGGTFPSIDAAVAAIERFMRSLEMCK